MPHTLHLILPGLLGPLPDVGELPRLPVLETLLARGDREPFPGADLTATLLSLFGVTAPAQGDWPSAPVCLLGDGGDPGPAYWLHADPVHLRPDMDRLTLFDARALNLGADEAAALADGFNRHFAADGLMLVTPRPDRWYLRLPAPPELRTHPLHEVNGRGVFPFLPEGADARRWRGLLNEFQMLFHQAPVNRGREAAGRPPVNGLWPWGGGVLPPVTGPGLRFLYGDDPLLRGIALLAGAEAQPLAERLAFPGDGDALALVPDLVWPVLDGDPAGWAAAAHAVDERSGDLSVAIKGGRFARVLIYPCAGTRIVLTRSGLRRFWRRRRPLPLPSAR